MAKKISKQATLEGKITHLRLYLSYAMQELRKAKNLTQKQLAKKLGVEQAAVSKRESAHAYGDLKLETIIRHAYELDAEILMAIKHGDEVFQVSDDEYTLVTDVPTYVQELAENQGLDVNEFVQQALESYMLRVCAAPNPIDAKITTENKQNT